MDNPSSSPLAGSWKEVRRPFLVALTVGFILLQLLFLGDVSYVYGTLFNETQRIHKFNLLYVNYDGDVVGQSVLDAYQKLQADNFPTLQPAPVGQYPTQGDVRGAVCAGDYWGAVYANPGASDSLTTALATGSRTPDTITYVWNGARYPAFTLGTIYTNIQVLLEATRGAYYAHNASYVLRTANLSSPAVVQTFLDPIHATQINIKVTNQGARILYGTVSMVMPVLQQFFFVMALNGVSAQFRVFTRISWIHNVCIRGGLSIVYTLVGALCMIGYIWGFKEGWDVNGNQFVLSWMIIWLYMQINFLVFDVVTTFVTLKFMPFCVLTWVLINLASTLSPFELNPGFYRWGYALPSHETYQVLVQIWSGGCNNQLFRALPIMFSWLVVGVVSALLCVHYRCRKALEAQQASAQAAEQTEEKFQAAQVIPRPEEVTPQRILRMESMDALLPRYRKETEDAMRMEESAYQPSYPTPLSGWPAESPTD